MEYGGGELRWSYSVDRYSRNLKQGSSANSPDRLVDICRHCPCYCRLKGQLLRYMLSAMEVINHELHVPQGHDSRSMTGSSG